MLYKSILNQNGSTVKHQAWKIECLKCAEQDAMVYLKCHILREYYRRAQCNYARAKVNALSILGGLNIDTHKATWE